MNTRKNTLWKPLDEAAKRLKIHRATLYRWIKLKRIKPREIDGFAFVDVYAVAEIIRQPRRTRGRMLAVQKVRREGRVMAEKPDPTAFNILSRAFGRIKELHDHGLIKDSDRAMCSRALDGIIQLVGENRRRPA
ncbi:MAG: helix-turn-helix domain-containing protein [Verrucomicrobiae bacterium]